MENSHLTCPTEENLSEYYDLLRDGRRDTPLVAQLEGHVMRCERCQAILEAYGKMDEAVAVTLRHPAPEALSESIRLECQRVAEDDKAVAESMPVIQQSNQRFAWYKWVGAAAVVGLVAGAVVSFWQKSPDKPHSIEYDAAIAMNSPMMQPAVELAEGVRMKEEPKEAAPDVFPETESDIAADEAAKPADNETITPAPSADVKSTDLQQVGTRKHKADARYANVSKRRISDVVRHVWTVENLDTCRTTLKSLERNEGVKVMFDDSEQGKVVAVVEGISDRQLQQLVDKFDDFHWALVSPKLPQPKQPEYVNFENRPVIYSFCAVKGVR